MFKIFKNKSDATSARLSAFQKPNHEFYKKLAGAVVLIIIAGVVGWVGGHWGNNGPNTLVKQRQIVTSSSKLISQIAGQVGPSVVSVGVTSQSTQTNFFGFSSPTTEQSAGTGIILSKDGLIITNRHVVPAGTTDVSVTLSDGTRFSDVKVLGRTDANSSLDIAFLKIQDLNGKKLVPATLGDSSKMQVGDKVVAIGNALGQFQNTVTFGIISGHNRSVTATDETGQNAEHLSDLFQTDAAINHGNSGGPLVNMNGQVIGINTAIAGQAQNIGFAIPINSVKGLIAGVKKTGKIEQPFLGVRFVEITPDYAYIYNLPVNHGAYIAPSRQTGQPAVVPGSPADKAGLKAKDIITKVDGKVVGQDGSLTSLLGQHQVGDSVTLTVHRGGKNITVVAKLGQSPSK